MKRIISLATVLVALLMAGVAQATVSGTPAIGTPQLNATGTTEQVRQIVQCGNTMYAVGSFTSIKKGSTVYTRNNVFSFSASAPYAVNSWNPNANGTVNTIAFANGNCNVAYLGGNFTSVGGGSAFHIAAVSTSTGSLIGTFAHSANAQVENIQAHGSELIVGGYFSSINGVGRNRLASLNASTGKVDTFVNLNVSGSDIYNQQLSPDGNYDLVEGPITSIGGVALHQIAMLDLTGTQATVTGWTSPGFSQTCSKQQFFVRAAAWSPDGSTVYIATTGYRLSGNSTFPLKGLCDAAASFPATPHASVPPNWINYTGCDSLYSAAADSTTAYFAGHERWSENAFGCDGPGPGAINAQGFEGLSPTNGNLTFNPTRSRGIGADDMLRTGSGLWIASDNLDNASMCGGQWGHAGICYLPGS